MSTTNATPVVYHPPATQSEALGFNEEAQIVDLEVEIGTISSEAEYQAASELARTIKARWYEIDERRKEITGPLVTATRSVNSLFKPALDRYAAIEDRIKLALGRYVASQEAAKVAAMSTLAAGGSVAVVPIRPEAQGVSVRMVSKWEIVDEEQVPRQFCSPDPAKIRAYLADGGVKAIKGIRFFEEPQTSVRRSK